LSNEYADDVGEFYSMAMAMAELLEAAQVPAGSIIVLPISEPEEDRSIDISFLTSSSLMYLQDVHHASASDDLATWLVTPLARLIDRYL
jgi:hypothetical protein